ncbi:NADPH-dependent FMN reductase [Glacieibacterium megasporae]|uniref:NADPH-dependent FMN reductase n=1 Tax=Glacieibacterium megasporae TaxID=2835787 RepID=UPI001C1E1D2B|nr:NADPH-dependent FMN reductase [Polymorphobacter megasporae]UAJ12984.1 NAD(P)H-dependent oxidoreductase [Polymorphobacter megasporae]
MKITVISCSLDPNSRSRRLAMASASMINQSGHDASLVDLRDLNGLPPFDNDLAFDDPRYELLHSAIQLADGIVIASPVYNWALSSTAKNLIEMTGATGDRGRRSAWFDKVVTFVCSGGLPHSYMAYGTTALSMMLDFKCIVNPYVVYATERDWSQREEPHEKLVDRLRKTLEVKLVLADRLRNRPYKSDWEV